jgi:prepilin-type N-terminal cleavage/methylation domain-containing protein
MRYWVMDKHHPIFRIKKRVSDVRKLNKKGITLIELIVVIAIFGIFTPLVLSFFVTGMQEFTALTTYTNQQNTVIDVIRPLRQDIEGCYKFKLDTVIKGNEYRKLILYFRNEDPSQPDIVRTWELRDDALWLGTKEAYDKIQTSETAANGTQYCKFEFSESNQKLMLTVFPKRNDKMFYKILNVSNPFTTQFTTKYKLYEK